MEQTHIPKPEGSRPAATVFLFALNLTPKIRRRPSGHWLGVKVVTPKDPQRRKLVASHILRANCEGGTEAGACATREVKRRNLGQFLNNSRNPAPITKSGAIFSVALRPVLFSSCPQVISPVDMLGGFYGGKPGGWLKCGNFLRRANTRGNKVTRMQQRRNPPQIPAEGQSGILADGTSTAAMVRRRSLWTASPPPSLLQVLVRCAFVSASPRISGLPRNRRHENPSQLH